MGPPASCTFGSIVRSAQAYPARLIIRRFKRQLCVERNGNFLDALGHKQDNLEDCVPSEFDIRNFGAMDEVNLAPILRKVIGSDISFENNVRCWQVGPLGRLNENIPPVYKTS
jgi:hypothetical protein